MVKVKLGVTLNLPENQIPMNEVMRVFTLLTEKVGCIFPQGIDSKLYLEMADDYSNITVETAGNLNEGISNE